jgi:hypothetical protein
MNRSLNVGAVLRRTFGTYVAEAPALWTAALLVAGVAALDQLRPARTTALALVEALADLLALGLFVGVVVLVAADVWDGRARRGVGGLLRGAWSALGRLLLAGVVAVLAISLVPSIGAVTLIGVIAGIVLGAKVGVAAVLLAALVLPVVVLIPELFLLTIWSVVVAVAVLERPPGLRARAQPRTGARQRVAGARADHHAHATFGPHRQRRRRGSSGRRRRGRSRHQAALGHRGGADPGARGHRTVLRAAPGRADPGVRWTGAPGVPSRGVGVLTRAARRMTLAAVEEHVTLGRTVRGDDCVVAMVVALETDPQRPLHAEDPALSSPSSTSSKASAYNSSDRIGDAR